ncbi:TIGR02611 family protein [Streptomyces sp. NPDC059740]|uniref:TIGR02611 family protein n=1 Tax=Streptomyces sp. NPDC059740 TaxID=3346926 RepID=UPI003656687F
MTTEGDGERGVSEGGATSAGEPSQESSREGLGSRAPSFVKRSRPLHLTWQVGVFVVGLAVVVGGVFLLPLPGPGWLVIFAGLAIWATEFVWAQLVLRWTRRKVTEATHRAMDPRVRRRNLVLTGLVVAVVVAAVVVYLMRYGFTAPWKLAG